MRTSSLVSLLPALILVAACGRTGAGLTADADTSAIRQLYRDWPRSVEAGDAARYVTFLHDSITLLIPGAAPIHGVSAYREFLTPLLQNATYRVSLESPAQLEVSGSWAFAQYRGQVVTFPRPSGDSSIARNRYVDILRRQSDGSWRVYLHSWHDDMAPAR